jgi:DNA polymerase I-like protein with 3'-5' exonuclease and polymerase domains
VPTVHPAACLRGQYLWRHLLISDLDRARQESESPKKNLLKRNIIIDPDFSTVLQYLNECLSLSAVGFDIEVLNHQVSCISFAKSATDAICIPFVAEGGKHRWTLEQEEQIWLSIASVLGNPQIMKVGQNLIFDIGFLLQQMNIHTSGPIGDTMIAHHIMFPDFPKGLDFLCSMHTREPYYKDDGKLYNKPWADLYRFWEYNAKDSAVCMEMWPLFEKMMKDDDYWQCYQDTVEMFSCLLYMMTRGVAVDVERLKETKREVEKKIKEKSDALEDVADYPFNFASPKQCQEYFYAHKGNKPYVSRSTGRPTTDDKAMSRIFRRFRYPEAKLVQELRSLSKLLGTYLEVEYDKDERVRCSYNPRGTTTGRLSSSKTVFGTGMNLQNLHPEFKGFLIARD